MIFNGRKICWDNIKFGRCIVCLWISCIFFATVVSSQDNFRPNGRFGKRENSMSLDSKAPVFQVGGRYGRNERGSGRSSGADSKLFIVPRVDRLYFGSRYGKRSELEDPRTRRYEAALGELADRIEKKLMDSELLRKALYPRSCYTRGEC